jgi:FkbM family methyltransferase
MKIWEVGVGEIDQSRTLQFIGTDIECHLFEPNPVSFEGIKNKLDKEANFKLYNFALGSKDKETNFYLARGSSFIEGLVSPEVAGNPNAEKEKEKITIDIKDVRKFDNGDIDILLIDTEGSEYDIIRSLISRPQKIIVEMYSFGVKYKNPFFDEIMGWMNINGYTITNQNEDFIFERIKI